MSALVEESIISLHADTACLLVLSVSDPMTASLSPWASHTLSPPTLTWQLNDVCGKGITFFKEFSFLL